MTPSLLCHSSWAVFPLLRGDWTKPSKRVWPYQRLPSAAEVQGSSKTALNLQIFLFPYNQKIQKPLPSKEGCIWQKENYFSLRLATYLFHKLKCTQNQRDSFLLALTLKSNVQCSALQKDLRPACVLLKEGKVKRSRHRTPNLPRVIHTLVGSAGLRLLPLCSDAFCRRKACLVAKGHKDIPCLSTQDSCPTPRTVHSSIYTLVCTPVWLEVLSYIACNKLKAQVCGWNENISKFFLLPFWKLS